VTRTFLAIHSYPGANDTVARHWRYFLRQKAQKIYGIGTEGGGCEWPGGNHTEIGKNSYIDGPVLPMRMLDTIDFFLPLDWDILIIAEYDTVIFNRIEVEWMNRCLAGHLAGGKTWESKAEHFYHNPWLFDHGVAEDFVRTGREAIADGICGKKTENAYATPEGSPDVFFGYMAEYLGLDVQDDLWTQYSQNDLKDHARLVGAREAFLNNVDVIHGIKTKDELDYITQPR